MIIVIAGPTGVGKTKLSIALAKQLNGEIINADSTQVFKDLDIATAKITEEEMEKIPHHLIDIKNITEDYTVYDYQQDARKKIKEIESKGHIPILVGGTGLYIKAALYDYEFQEENSLKIDYSKFTNEELYQQLLKVDPNTKIHINNRKRVERALDYFEKNHVPMSDKKIANKLLYDTIFIGLTTDREILYKQINRRVEKMLNEGLLKEAKKIYDSSIRTKAIMTPIGYKELFEYFDGNCTLEDAVYLIQKRSRNYAKRQYTWFNHQLPMRWFDVDFNNFNNTVIGVLNYIKDVKK